MLSSPFVRHPGESRDPGLEHQHVGFPLALDPGFRRGDGIPLEFYDSLLIGVLDRIGGINAEPAGSGNQIETRDSQ